MLVRLATRYGLAVLASLAAVATWGPMLRPWLAHPYVLFLSAVALACWYGGIGPGLAAAIVGLLVGASSYPSLDSAFGEPAGVTQAVAYVLGVVAVGWGHLALQRELRPAATIMAGLSEGVLLVTTAGRITFATPSALHMLGQDEDNLVGTKLHGAVCRCTNSTGGRGECVVTAAIRAGRAIRDGETVFRCKDGTEMTVTYRLSPLRSGTRLTGSVLSFWDVSEAARQRTALVAQARIHQALTTHAPIAMFLADEYGYIVLANAETAKLFGYEDPQLLKGVSSQHLFASDERHRVSQLRQSVLDGPDPLTGEFAALKHTGSSFVAEVRMVGAGRDAEGTRLFACAVHDTTERRQREAGYYIEAYGDGPDPEVVATAILAESATLSETMPRLLQTLCTSGGWDVGTFWAVDPSENVLRCRAIWRMPSVEVPEFEVLCQQLAFPPGVDLPGRVLETRSTAWVPDVVADAGILRALMASKEGLRAACGFPILQGSTVHGVIEFFSRDVRPPNAFLEDKMSHIGRQIGRFIERKQVEKSLAHQARHDALTDLPNRLLLNDRLPRTLRAAGGSQKPVAFLLIDLDRFKQVNDTYGHHYGDALLQQVAGRLRSVLRESDTVARLGGDEFGVILPGASDIGARVVADKIIAALHQPFRIDGHDLEVGGSIGIAVYPDHATDAEALMQLADSAMYAAKRAESGYVVYSSDVDTLGAHRRHG